MSDTVEIMAEEFKIAYPLTYDAIYEKGRADAIEELVDAICCHSAFTNMQKDAIKVYAEQLKEKNNDT